MVDVNAEGTGPRITSWEDFAGIVNGPGRDAGSARVEARNVYLSGPMTGLGHFNVEAFVDAHALLKELGAERVYDPAITYLCETRDESGSRTHEDYMLSSLHELTRRNTFGVPLYDLVVLLPGWNESRGATFEAAAARWCGIPTVPLAEVSG